MKIFLDIGDDYTEVVNILIKNGADVNQKTILNQTSLMLGMSIYYFLFIALIILNLSKQATPTLRSA